jgi:hypothetical protein
VRPDPLSEAAARRHELTRSRAIQALRDLDRAGAPVTFAGVAQAAGISRSWLYTQPDISSQIRRLREKAESAGSAGAIPAGQRATGASLRARLTAALDPTGSSPTRTPGSAAISPAHSATSGRNESDQVTIQEAERTAIRPRASRRRHCPRRDTAGQSIG